MENTVPNFTKPQVYKRPKSQDLLSQTGNRQNSLKFLGIGLFEIGFVLIILIFFFGILNYFNILSLSSLYPQQLGFLPHRPFAVQKTEPTVNLKNNLAVNPKFKNYTKLESQATDTQISNFITLISAKRIPLDNSDYPEEIYGIFSGYSDKYIQVVSYNGIKNLPYTKDLTIQKFGEVIKSATQSGASVKLIQIEKNNFFNQNMFGKILHLTIPSVSPATIQQIYLTE